MAGLTRIGNAIDLSEAYPYQPVADSFDFRKSWARVRHACISHKRLIAATCLVTVALTMIYIAAWPPVYSAKVELIGESDKDMSREGFYQSWAVFRKEQLADEVQLFTAEPVLAEVINRMHLTYGDVYHSFLGHLGYLWSESLPGRAYHKFKESLFPHHPGPYDPTPEQAEAARTLDAFKGGVRLEAVQDTNLGNLVVNGPTPRVAEIANMIVKVYLENRQNRHLQEAQGAYDALDEEAMKAKQEINAVEDRMRQYYSDNNMLLTFEKDKLDIGQTATLRASIADLETSIASVEQTLAKIDTELAKENRNVIASRVIQQNPIKESLRSNLSQLEIQRKQTLIHFRPDSPEIKEIDRQIAIVHEQMSSLPDENNFEKSEMLSGNYEQLRGRRTQLLTELAGERASLAVRQREYEEANQLLQTIPEKMRVVHDMEREHSALENKYNAIQEKLMMAAVSRATARSAPSSISVIADATPPSKASWPNAKLLVLLAIVAGSIAGIVLALIIDLLFGRVHRYRLRDIGGDLPVYAMLRRDAAYAAELFALPAPSDQTGWRLLQNDRH